MRVGLARAGDEHEIVRGQGCGRRAGPPTPRVVAHERFTRPEEAAGIRFVERSPGVRQGPKLLRPCAGKADPRGVRLGEIENPLARPALSIQKLGDLVGREILGQTARRHGRSWERP